jgi:hypothetical protein
MRSQIGFAPESFILPSKFLRHRFSSQDDKFKAIVGIDIPCDERHREIIRPLVELMVVGEEINIWLGGVPS